MKYGSVCSGIEAATVAWHHMGWEPQWFSEIEAFPSSVLSHHYPNVPNHGDMTTFKEWPNDPIDILVGGTPCQSFSVAGLRKGLDDPRGNLMLTYLAIAERYAPRWIVWENVPGVLSSNGGRDFGTFLGALGKIGYGFAYRVLDAQYFGVAQRRRRVFVVGYLGDWRRAAAVLFERESLSGHPAPSRQAREDVAGTFKACASSGGWSNSADHAAAGYMIPVCAPLNTQLGLRGADTSNTSREGVGIGNDGDPSFTLQAAHSHAVISISARAFAQNTRDEVRLVGGDGEISGALAAHPGMKQTTYVAPNMAVRRLTPRECERLQGFPDDYTLTPHRGKPAADGPRYKALGNSMAVPVMRWIGERIQMVDQI